MSAAPTPAASTAPVAEGSPPRPPRVLIVGENSALRMGGEASYPYFFFKLLRERRVEAWLVTHARTRDEMRTLLPEASGRFYFVEEDRLDIALWKLGSRLPQQITDQTISMIRHLLFQLRVRRLVARVVREQQIDIVHETTPISPKAPSGMYGLDVPVVIGPLAGGMNYPPGFRHMQSGLSRLLERLGRAVSHLANWLVPGKLRAESLVVANERSRRALPQGVLGTIYDGIPEVSVDLSIWEPQGRADRPADVPVRFVYLGRLVDWKAVDLLLEAFRVVVDSSEGATLEILGDGPDRASLEARAERLGLAGRVTFAGWVTAAKGAARMREADVFVLPSLRECGGAVLLEAMALGLPVVTTNWGGPGLYVDDASGIRVDPRSRTSFIAGLADAMLRLARSPELRRRMGESGRRRVVTEVFSWNRKIDRFLEIYRETIDRSAAGQRVASPTSPGVDVNQPPPAEPVV